MSRGCYGPAAALSNPALQICIGCARIQGRLPRNGRSAASEQRHPRPRSGPARAHLLRARRGRFGDRDERVEVRRLRVRDGAQSVGRPRCCATACNTCSTARRSPRPGSCPPVTPMVRIPVNGVEMAQWHAKQALDIGCYGIVFPHISTVEEAANAVGACRYPRLKNAAALRARRHPRRRPDRGGALLGHRPAGVLPEGRRLAAQPAGRDLLHPADRGHPRRRQSRRHAEERAGHRRHPDRRRRSLARSSAIRASTSTRSCWNG